MLLVSIIFFAVAAVFGVLNLVPILKNNPTSKPIVIIHGLLAATGLVLLIIYSVNAESSPVLSIVLFVIAAIGGFILFARDMSKKPGPKKLAIIHGGVAVIAFIILLLFAFSI